MACDTETSCVNDGCNPVFSRLVVSYIIRGGTFVSWELQTEFTTPGPYTFQLQIGTTLSNNADDWEDVGFPVVNQFAAIDDQKRVWGMNNWTHYRIKLTTNSGVFYSNPVGGMGTLDKRSWLDAREIIRQAKVNLQKGHWGQPGFLLKRRVTGIKCNTCTDYATGAIDRDECPECYSTGYSCGYYYPIDCVWAGRNPAAHHTKIDSKRGTVADKASVTNLVMSGLGVLGEGDIWVSLRTDERFVLHDISPTMLYRGIPLTFNVGFRQVPMSSIIYDIPIPQQLADVSNRYLIRA
jgi:hypothetical protein